MTVNNTGNAGNALQTLSVRVMRSLRYRLRPDRLLNFIKADIIVPVLAQTERRTLQLARQAHEAEYAKPGDPLISITIATYNRSNILLERTLPSVFSQSYQNFEVIIVGDGCTDDTFVRLQALKDPRIRSINLPERGRYPANKIHRHFVAGTYPINRAFQEVQGQWIAHLDDDEVWVENHLESLLNFAQQHAYEFVSGYARVEIGPGHWEVLTSAPFKAAHGRNIHHSTVMMRSYLKLFKLDPRSWWYNLAVDWHSFSRMAACGVRDGVLEKVVNEAPLRPGTTMPWADAEDRE